MLRWAIPGLLMITVGLTFGPAVQGGFVWDDNDLICNNAYIKDFAHIGRNLTHPFWDVSSRSDSWRLANDYYRPVVTLTFMLDHKSYGLRPWGYHLTNLLLHLLAVLLVFHLAHRISNHTLAAVVCALVFALHPSRAEAVAWISGRADLLAAIFLVTALILFHGALQGRRRVLYATAAWLAYLVGLLCKESVVALSLLVPLLDWLVVSRGRRSQLLAHFRWCHLPLVVVSLGYIAVHLALASANRAELGVGAHVALVLQSLAEYARLIVAPYHPSIQVGGEFDPHSPSWGLVSLGAVTLLLVLAATWLALRHQRRIVALGLLVLVVTLVPVSNIIPLQLRVMVAERFLYLPLLGLGLILGGVVRRWNGWPVLVALALLLSSWAVTSHARSGDYRSPERLWRTEVARNPDNPMAMYFLGDALANRGSHDEAERWLGRAFVRWSSVSRERQWPLVALLRVLDVRLLRTDDWDVGFLRRAAAFLEALLEAKDARLDVPGVGAFAVHVDSKIREVLQDLRPGIVGMLGMVQSRLGRDVEAMATLERAVTLDPHHLEAVLNLALACSRAGALDRAQKAARQARSLSPDDPGVRAIQGALAQAAPRILALQHLTDPVQRHLRRAELLIVTRAPRRACEELRRAIRLDPRQPRAHIMLVMELASAGRLDAALESVRTARGIFGDIDQLRKLERDARGVARRGSRRPEGSKR